MKKVLATVMLTICLATPVLAGHIEMPPATQPPPPPDKLAADEPADADLLTFFVSLLQVVL